MKFILVEWYSTKWVTIPRNMMNERMLGMAEDGVGIFNESAY